MVPIMGQNAWWLTTTNLALVATLWREIRGSDPFEEEAAVRMPSWLGTYNRGGVMPCQH
jgi:hypothetical protein